MEITGTEGEIIVQEHLDIFGNPERYDYRWEGDDRTLISRRLLYDADPQEVKYGTFPSETGDKFSVGPFDLRVLESCNWRYDVIIALRERGIITDLRLLWHRASKFLDLAYRHFIITLAIWRLADYDSAVIPTWQDIYLVKRLGGLQWPK